MAKGTLRIAATADLHYAKHSRWKMHDAFAEISGNADVLLLCGDFTDYGMPEEARILARDLSASVKIPVIAVLGNHDFEAGHEAEITQILDDYGVPRLALSAPKPQP